MKKEDGIVPLDIFSEAVVNSQLKASVNKISALSDLATATYPDQEAMRASHMADDLFAEICDGLNVEGINCDLIRQGENESVEGIERSVNKEISKIDKYISRQTGVSLQRIKKATTFWNDTVIGD